MKCRLPPKEPTEKQLQEEREANIRSNDQVFNYVGRLLAISVRKNAGFGIVRFERFNDNSHDIGQEFIKRYSSDCDKDEDYAVYSYYALRRELCYIGWDPEVELWADDVFDKYFMQGGSRSQRQKQAAFVGYAKGISFYTREMLCMSALELNRTNKFGAERLNRVFHPVRDTYLNLMGIYLRQDIAGYFVELRRVQKEFNELGIFKSEEKL